MSTLEHQSIFGAAVCTADRLVAPGFETTFVAHRRHVGPIRSMVLIGLVVVVPRSYVGQPLTMMKGSLRFKHGPDKAAPHMAHLRQLPTSSRIQLRGLAARRRHQNYMGCVLKMPIEVHRLPSPASTAQLPNVWQRCGKEHQGVVQ